jgi:hypothetical protein
MKKIIIICLLLLLSVSLFMCSDPMQPKAAVVLVPELYLPYNGSTNVALAPILKWKNNANKLQISVNASFNTVQYNVNVTGTRTRCPGSAVNTCIIGGQDNFGN